MGKYNSGRKYNVSSLKNGLTYNYLSPTVVIRVTDAMNVLDQKITFEMIRISLLERMTVGENIDTSVNIAFNDYLKIVDEEKMLVETLVNVLEKFDILDSFINVVTEIRVIDNQNLITDSIFAFTEMLVQEGINLREDLTLEALLEIVDSYEMTEIYNLLSEIRTQENVGVNDKDPRTAITDFFIGQIEGLDERFLGFSPLDMYYDRSASVVPIMPVTESTYIDIPNKDGSLVQNTVYKNRFFELVVYSMQGLTPIQVQEMIQNITKVLDSTKDEAKVMTFVETDTTFDVKYSGQATILQGSSWVKAVLPFESQPYARKLFPVEFDGNGLIYNDGDANIGAVVTITGECLNPRFTIGATEFYWQGTVGVSEKLVIDNENMTCYLLDKDGKKINALPELTKGSSFVQVLKGQSLTVTAYDEETRSKMSTTYNPLILWYGGE